MANLTGRPTWPGRTDETRRCLNYLRDAAARWTVEIISPERRPGTSHKLSARSLGLRGPPLASSQRDGPQTAFCGSVPKSPQSTYRLGRAPTNPLALILPAASSATWLQDRSYRTASGQPGRCACRAIRSPLEGCWVAPLRGRRGTFFGGAKQIVRERGRLRRQDLEGSPLTCRGRSYRATSYGDQGQEQRRGGHKV